MKTLPDRVEDVVIAWSGLTGFPTSTGLSVLWANSAHSTTIPFQPQAVMTLITRLQSEFQNQGPDLRDLSEFKPGSFAPPGTIDTVDDLVSAILFAPQATPHAVIAGFALDAAKQEFVNAIADEVAKRLKQSEAGPTTLSGAKAKKQNGGANPKDSDK